MSQKDPVALLLVILLVLVLFLFAVAVVSYQTVKWAMKRDERRTAEDKQESDERKQQNELLISVVGLIPKFTDELHNYSEALKETNNAFMKSQENERERFLLREKTLGDQTIALKENTNVTNKLSDNLQEVIPSVEKQVGLIETKLDAALKDAPEILKDAFYALLQEYVMPILDRMEQAVLADLEQQRNQDTAIAKNQRDWDATLGRIDQKFNEMVKAQAELKDAKQIVNSLSEKMRELIESIAHLTPDKTTLPAVDSTLDTPLTRIAIDPKDLIYFSDKAKRSHAMVIEAILAHIDSLVQPQALAQFQKEYDAAEHDEQRIQICQVWLSRAELADMKPEVKIEPSIEAPPSVAP